MSRKVRIRAVCCATGIAAVLLMSGHGGAAPVPGGTLDPMTVPKYVTPLVILPQMPKSTVQPGKPAADYNIAMKQFQQQILPGGVWNTLNKRNDIFPATTVWSYGRSQDALPQNFVAPAPLSTKVSFNYPAYTVENTVNQPTSVRWINGLVDSTGKFLPHLLPIDQTLHWANPPMICRDGTRRTNCEGVSQTTYLGPVPMVVHLHGSHVNSESDGYPEAWWLPAATNIPTGYATKGSMFSQYDLQNRVPASAYYKYENDQPATTLWFHDHSLGLTRENVYVGPAAFWLLRGGKNGDAAAIDGVNAKPAVLPGPAPKTGAGDPNFDPAYRKKIREIPVMIQDRSFNADGSLFYPAARSFFDNYPGPYYSPVYDIAPIWNPEAFFNTIVVNGATWPILDVAPARYRLRLLNASNSRTLNLSAYEMVSPGTAAEAKGPEMPFFQIGGDQGFLPQVVLVKEGVALPLAGNGVIPALPPVDTTMPQRALLMGPAERADLIVDFTGLPSGTIVRIFNTAPDFPFQGFGYPWAQAADPGTTGQVMEFRVNASLVQPSDALTTPPQNLILPAEGPIGPATATLKVSLNEMDSDQICVTFLPDGTVGSVLFADKTPQPDFLTRCTAAGGLPMGPRQALLGTVTGGPGAEVSNPLRWMMPMTEKPIVNTTDEWEIYNMTVDGHPIHLHLVRFKVINRQPLKTDPVTGAPIPAADSLQPPVLPGPTEAGYKDTAIALPGMVTRVRAVFDRIGQYIWHCHILEHEDNEMMRPYAVVANPAFPDLDGDGALTMNDYQLMLQEVRRPEPRNPGYDLNGDGVVNLLDAKYLHDKIKAAKVVPKAKGKKTAALKGA